MALPALLRDTLSIPAVGAPLFIVSNPDLVIEQCKAGIVGAFPALNARPKEMLEEWLKRITGELADYKAKHPEKKVAPFAVNQIVHSSNDRLQHDVDLCEKYKVPIQITSLRAPDDVVPSAKRYGCLVFHDVTNVKHAKRALQAGVDGLILVCAGAGGHAGRPVALRAGAGSAPVLRRLPPALGLDRQRRQCPGRAGGRRRPRLSRHALHRRQGSQRHRRQQAMHHRIRRGEEIVYTNLFTGVHGNYLKKSIAAAGPRSRRPAGGRQEQDELRLGRQQQGQGVARHLGRGPGRRPDLRRPAGRRDRGPPQGRVRGGPAALSAGETVPTRLKEAARVTAYGRTQHLQQI